MSWVFDDVAFIEDENNTRIAMFYSYDVPDWKRNGRLIAASDKMYKMMRELVGVLALHDYSSGTAYEINQLLQWIDGEKALKSCLKDIKREVINNVQLEL